MKTLYESIFDDEQTYVNKSNRAADVIENSNGEDFKEITFEEFVLNIDPNKMAQICKQAYSDSTKSLTNGYAYFVFRDGLFLIEIISLGKYGGGKKWWRSLFLKNGEYNKNYHLEQLALHTEKTIWLSKHGAEDFYSDRGERMTNVAPRYIEYLKNNCKTFYDCK